MGLHGDDGGVGEESGAVRYSTEYNFGPGNTVGCGVDYDKGEYHLPWTGKS